MTELCKLYLCIYLTPENNVIVKHLILKFKLKRKILIDKCPRLIKILFI